MLCSGFFCFRKNPNEDEITGNGLHRGVVGVKANTSSLRGAPPRTDKAFIGFGTWDGGVSATPSLDHRVKGRLGSSSEDLSPTPGPKGKADCATKHRDSARYRA